MLSFIAKLHGNGCYEVRRGVGYEMRRLECRKAARVKKLLLRIVSDKI